MLLLQDVTILRLYIYVVAVAVEMVGAVHRCCCCSQGKGRCCEQLLLSQPGKMVLLYTEVVFAAR